MSKNEDMVSEERYLSILDTADKLRREGWDMAAAIQTLEKENDALQQRLNAAIEALKWAGGSEDFGPNGRAREGWEKLVAPVLRVD